MTSTTTAAPATTATTVDELVWVATVRRHNDFHARTPTTDRTDCGRTTAAAPAGATLTLAEALAAGMRPCPRCWPLGLPATVTAANGASAATPPAVESEIFRLLTPPPGVRLDGHGGWWAPVDVDDDMLPPDPTLGVGIEGASCLADCPYEPEGSNCTVGRHGPHLPHVAGDGDHTIAVWWEPGHEPGSKVWACPQPGCGYHIADGPVPDGEPTTVELIAEHQLKHDQDQQPEPGPVEAAPAVDPEAVERAAFCAGLRELADWLDAHPQVPLPHISRYAIPGCSLPSLAIYLHAPGEGETSKPDVATQMAMIARAMGRANKNTAAYSDEKFLVWRAFAGIAVFAQAERDEVCERVVTGTREVTEEVPDPAALAAVPKVTVTKTIEEVEWVCRPLLGDEPEVVVS